MTTTQSETIISLRREVSELTPYPIIMFTFYKSEKFGITVKVGNKHYHGKGSTLRKMVADLEENIENEQFVL